MKSIEKSLVGVFIIKMNVVINGILGMKIELSCSYFTSNSGTFIFVFFRDTIMTEIIHNNTNIIMFINGKVVNKFLGRKFPLDL